MDRPGCGTHPAWPRGGPWDDFRKRATGAVSCDAVGGRFAGGRDVTGLSPSVPLVLVGAAVARGLDVTGEAGARAQGAATEGAATQVVLEGMEHGEGRDTAVSSLP